MADAFLGPRSDYQNFELNEGDVPADPIEFLQMWLDEALTARVLEPTAMCLATADADGNPSSRMVLLRGLDARGLAFYTNYLSRKASELSANPHASLCFWWGAMERQVRVEGGVQPVSDAESDAYFASRPYESQLASAASPQSMVVPSRADLEARVAALRAAHPDSVPRPQSWGGFRLVPTRWEFWQGRSARLHDRFEYVREADGWRIQRLAP